MPLEVLFISFRGSSMGSDGKVLENPIVRWRKRDMAWAENECGTTVGLIMFKIVTVVLHCSHPPAATLTSDQQRCL